MAGLLLLSALVYYKDFYLPVRLADYFDTPYLETAYLFRFKQAYLSRMVNSWLALGGLYVIALWLAYRLKGKLAWALVLGGSLLFAAPLLYTAPFGSNDIFDYIVRGRILGLYHFNPFVYVPAQFPGDVFSYYAAWRYAPSAYGPVWEAMASFTARVVAHQISNDLQDNILYNVIAFKLIAGVFLIGSTALIALILNKKAPNYALAGTLLFAWNPVVLFQVWGNGHNDSVLVFWVLLAAWALINDHFTTAIMALVMGTLVKYIPALLIPAAGLMALYRLPDWKSRGRFVLVTGILSLAVVIVSFAPFWVGVKTLAMESRTKMFTASPAATLYYSLIKTQKPDHLASVLSKVSAGATALVALASAFWAMRRRTWQAFAQAAFGTLAFYLLLAVLWFWPWYTIWLLALAPLILNRHVRNLAILFSFTSMVKPYLFYQQILQNPRLDLHLPWVERSYMLGVYSLPWLYLAAVLAILLVMKARPAYATARQAWGTFNERGRVFGFIASIYREPMRLQHSQVEADCEDA